MLRCKAECDPTFKQVIPYVLVEHEPTGRFFVTTRIGGEERLAGQVSIGLGGHLDDGEDVPDALFRELEEEIGLTKGMISMIELCGFISSDLNEVDSVHLGVVYHAFTDQANLFCRESEKLTGGWFTVSEMRAARRDGRMESWSEICFDKLVDVERDAMVGIIPGVQPDVPIEVNENGGRQSATPYAFHFLPPRALFAAAEVAKYGAEKYGETLLNRNYNKISPEEHVNHAIQHLFAYLAGDQSDNHLSHAILRAMFAYEVDHERDRTEGKA